VRSIAAAGVLTLAALIAVALTALHFTHASSAAHSRLLSTRFSPWGWQSAAQTQLNAPSSTAVDSQGNVFVADTGNNRILKLSSDGRLLASWTNSGSSDGPFASPEGVAVDLHGNVFVTDTGNSQTVELSPAGKQLHQWAGSYLFGYSVNATAIAVDNHGDLYIVDTHYNCIMRLEIGSRNDKLWCGSDVLSPASFAVAGVAVDPHGDVYASDTNTDRVVRLPPSLGPRALAQWLVRRPSSGRPVSLAGLASDRQGNLYAVDAANNRVSKLSGTGKVLASWKFSGSPAGLLTGPAGVTVDRQGTIYVAVSGNDSVQKIPSSKSSIVTWSKLGSPTAHVDEPHSVATDHQGDVFVITGSSRNHILKFSARGVLLSDWGPSVLRQAGMYVLAGLTTDRQGNLYASDALNNRLYKLSSTGRLLARWKVNELHSPSSHRTSAEPYGIAVDSHGEIYVADVGDQALKKLSPDGKYLDQAILPGVPNSGTHETCSDCALPDPKLITPREVAVDPNGVTYVLDSDHHVIIRVSPAGKVLGLWGSKGSASGALKSPVRLAVDRRGNVFVLDAAQNKVFEYSPQGDLLARWGAKGSKPGQLLSPDGIAVDSAGNVYVADTGNNRLQRLALGR